MTPTNPDDLIVAADQFIADQGPLDKSLDVVATFRDTEKNFAAAADVQQRKVLEPLQRFHEQLLALTDRDTTTEQVRRRVAAKLADAYGSLGGLRRKLNELEPSLKLYEAGAALERDPANRITAVYNLTNKINLTIVQHPERFAGPALKDEIVETLDRIQKPNDFWKVADAGLLSILAGKDRQADEYYTRLSGMTGVEEWKRRSASGILTSLAAALEHIDSGCAVRLRAAAERVGGGHSSQLRATS